MALPNPVPTNRQDGTTIRANHVNDLGEAINGVIAHVADLPPGGYSAYELALQDGFVGSVEEWLESLKSTAPSTVPGPPGDPGAIPPGLLADRPAASSVPDGTSYTATDDRGGAQAVAAGDDWIPAAPPVAAVGGRLLGIAAPTANVTATIAAANTDQPIPALTIPAFVWPDAGRVLVQAGIVRSFGVQTPALLGIKYRVNGGTWVACHPNLVTSPAGTSPFWAHEYHFAPALVPVPTAVPITPGASVEIAMTVQHPTNGQALTFAVAGGDVYPFLAAYLLAA